MPSIPHARSASSARSVSQVSRSSYSPPPSMDGKFPLFADGREGRWNLRIRHTHVGHGRARTWKRGSALRSLSRSWVTAKEMSSIVCMHIAPSALGTGRGVGDGVFVFPDFGTVARFASQSCSTDQLILPNFQLPCRCRTGLLRGPVVFSRAQTFQFAHAQCLAISLPQLTPVDRPHCTSANDPLRSIPLCPRRRSVGPVPARRRLRLEKPKLRLSSA